MPSMWNSSTRWSRASINFVGASTRVLILTSQGRIFSAGADLLRILSGAPAYIRVFMPILTKAFETLFCYPKPVIAAINGHAIAGGCVLVCAADCLIMARQSGRIGLSEMLWEF